MEERARKGELVDDISDTGSHEQIERVVVSKSQHTIHTSGSRKEAGSKWAKHFRSLVCPPPESLAQGSCLHISSRPFRVF